MLQADSNGEIEVRVTKAASGLGTVYSQSQASLLQSIGRFPLLHWYYFNYGLYALRLRQFKILGYVSQYYHAARLRALNEIETSIPIKLEGRQLIFEKES